MGNDNNNLITTGGKSFWKKNEGIFTMVLVGLGGLAGLYYSQEIFAAALNILASTVMFATTLGIIAGGLFLVTNKGIRAAVSTLWELSLRKVLGLVIVTDPIGILKIKIQEAFDECNKIGNEIKNFYMEIGKVENRININEKTAKTKFDKANYLLDQKEDELAETESAYAARLIQMNNDKLVPLKKEMTAAVKYLEQLKKNLFVKTERTKNEIEIQEIEFNAMTSGRNAMNAALRAYQGNPDKRMLYEMTAEHLESEIGKMMGEIKMGVAMTRDFMKSSDLENGEFNAKGLKMLQQYKANGIKGLSEDNNTINLPISNASKISVGNNNNNKTQGSIGNTYHNLLD